MIDHRGSMPVNQLDLDGNILASYSSAVEASKKGGVDKDNIGKVCRGQRKMAGGFKWNYYKGGNNE